jgi:GNAT superfamily N-acetyltransferase
MEPDDRSEVAELIYVSLNYWTALHGRPPVFTAGPASTEIFGDVYGALDPGCGVVAVNEPSGRLMGSCFFHPRPRHVTLGILNVHPNYFGQGVARAMVARVVDYAKANGGQPVRLVQSALNLDSFSLYTRMGFVPRWAYQDMLLDVPGAGLAAKTPGHQRVRAAATDDVTAMGALEMEVAGITREKDYAYLIQNDEGIWDAQVYEDPDGRIGGFLFSVKHPALSMLGPCVARTQGQAEALIARAAERFRGGGVVAVVPVECDALVRSLYGWGARNCELHLGQVLGPFQPFRGVSMPTYLPETG